MGSWYQTFTLTVSPQATVLDLLEIIRVDHDPDLTYRHSCHHACCGQCAVRINGVERLACVTHVAEVHKKNGEVLIEPLRGLPIVSDLVVEMTPFNMKLAMVGLPSLRTSELSGEPPSGGAVRLESCLECGACVSACPVAVTDPHYLGPAALAAIYRLVEEPRGQDEVAALALADTQHGCWRCHTAFECSEVCPNGVDPGAAIMRLRRQLLLRRVLRFLRLEGPPAGQTRFRSGT